MAHRFEANLPLASVCSPSKYVLRGKELETQPTRQMVLKVNLAENTQQEEMDGESTGNVGPISKKLHMNDPINILPEEMLAYLFTYLPVVDKLSVKLVCTKWYGVSQTWDTKIWISAICSRGVINIAQVKKLKDSYYKFQSRNQLAWHTSEDNLLIKYHEVVGKPVNGISLQTLYQSISSQLHKLCTNGPRISTLCSSISAGGNLVGSNLVYHEGRLGQLLAHPYTGQLSLRITDLAENCLCDYTPPDKSMYEAVENGCRIYDTHNINIDISISAGINSILRMSENYAALLFRAQDEGNDWRLQVYSIPARQMVGGGRFTLHYPVFSFSFSPGLQIFTITMADPLEDNDLETHCALLIYDAISCECLGQYYAHQLKNVRKLFRGLESALYYQHQIQYYFSAHIFCTVNDCSYSEDFDEYRIVSCDHYYIEVRQIEKSVRNRNSPSPSAMQTMQPEYTILYNEPGCPHTTNGILCKDGIMSFVKTSAVGCYIQQVQLKSGVPLTTIKFREAAGPFVFNFSDKQLQQRAFNYRVILMAIGKRFVLFKLRDYGQEWLRKPGSALTVEHESALTLLDLQTFQMTKIYNIFTDCSVVFSTANEAWLDGLLFTSRARPLFIHSTPKMVGQELISDGGENASSLGTVYTAYWPS